MRVTIGQVVFSFNDNDPRAEAQARIEVHLAFLPPLQETLRLFRVHLYNCHRPLAPLPQRSGRPFLDFLPLKVVAYQPPNPYHGSKAIGQGHFLRVPRVYLRRPLDP